MDLTQIYIDRGYILQQSSRESHWPGSITLQKPLMDFMDMQGVGCVQKEYALDTSGYSLFLENVWYGTCYTKIGWTNMNNTSTLI